MTGSHIRSATLADAEAIARVHVLSWQSAYQGLLPDEMLANLSIEQRTKQWAQWLQESSETQVLVGVQAVIPGGRHTEHVVGFVCGGPERTGNPEYDGEIYAIYLLPTAQGQGLGRRLFQALQTLLQESGLSQQLVWVLSSNQSACAFYARLGGVG